MIFNFLKKKIRKFGMMYVNRISKKEYENQKFLGVNERPIEFAFLFGKLISIWPIKILDVGTGQTALPHLMRNCGFMVTAIDNIKDYWPEGMINRHYYVVDDDITNTKLTEKFDVVTCISVLEHIVNHDRAMATMAQLLSPEGYLILTCPYNEKMYVQNVYKLPESNVKINFTFQTQSFSRKELDRWCVDNSLEIVDQEFWQYFDGEFWTCGNKLDAPKQVNSLAKHQLTCILFKKIKSEKN